MAHFCIYCGGQCFCGNDSTKFVTVSKKIKCKGCGCRDEDNEDGWKEPILNDSEDDPSSFNDREDEYNNPYEGDPDDFSD